MSDRKIVRIGPSHYHVGHIVPAMVAKELSYFEEEGLTNYDLIHGGLIPAIAEKLALRRAMTEKGVDIAPDVKPSALFQMASREEDVFIVGCWRNRADFRWFGAKGIEGPAGLRGKRVGVRDIGGIDHVALRTLLKRAGLDPDRDVTFLRGARFHPQEHPEEFLRSGEVDCIALSGPDSRGLEDEGYPLLGESRKLYPGGRPDRVITTTRRMVEEDSDLLMAYLRATIRAYWIITNFDGNRWYLEALVKRLRRACLDEEEAARSGLEAGGKGAVPIDGAPSIFGLHEMVQEAIELGELDEDFEIEPILRLEFVQQAFKELEARDELKEQLAKARAINAEEEEARVAGRA